MIKKWNDQLEKIFETNTQDLTLIESQQSFELNADNTQLENLSYIHSSVTSTNRTNVFSQLCPFFEIGFLLEKQNKNYAPTQAFAFGQPIRLDQKAITLNLPQTSLFAVVKTPATSILKKMNFEFLNSRQKMNAFIIAISPQFSVLVATEMAEPWIKVRLEILQKALMKISFE